MLKLREYQRECIESIFKAYKSGNNRLICSLATAAGKTIIFANFINEVDCRTLILAHTQELLDQAKEKINMFCPDLDVGIVNSDFKQFEKQVVVCSIQAAAVPANLTQLQSQNFQVLVYDECHHAASDSARIILDSLGFGKGTNKLLVGFTATAFRQDKKGLGEIFDKVAYEKNTKELIEEGYLVKPKGFKIATDIDLSKIKTEDGDFQKTALAEIMDTPAMNETIVNAYIERAYGLKTIVFGVNIKHAENISKAFNSVGISSKLVSGDTQREDRKQILEEYQAGQIKVLCNCQVLTEGFDAPSTECIIVARPTKSKGLYQQMLGRGLRLWPNKKECIVLDFCDKNHSICNVATLLLDYDDGQARKDREKKEQFKNIPKNLNPKLKTALINYDPLGQNFYWEKDGQTYFMEGLDGVQLEVKPAGNNLYKVVYFNSFESFDETPKLSFEYAFAAAEDLAKEYKKFILKDKSAPWRDKQISEDQKKVFIKGRYKSGINELTRGQAATLIGSGILRNNKQQ
jgi:superfamily II DNA or RNA helicase